VHDAALISHAQRIVHYEIATYGMLKAFAKHLNLKKIEEWLEETSKEEGRWDKRLTEIAEGSVFSRGINKKASKREVA
jgi:ferritin-like metal-binding protein YciE